MVYKSICRFLIQHFFIINQIESLEKFRFQENRRNGAKFYCQSFWRKFDAKTSAKNLVFIQIYH